MCLDQTLPIFLAASFDVSFVFSDKDYKPEVPSHNP